MVDNKEFDFLGTQGSRPLEVATLRLQNMRQIVTKWNKLAPPNKELITQQGGTVVFEGRDTVYSYKDKARSLVYSEQQFSDSHSLTRGETLSLYIEFLMGATSFNNPLSLRFHRLMMPCPCFDLCASHRAFSSTRMSSKCWRRLEWSCRDKRGRFRAGIILVKRTPLALVDVQPIEVERQRP